MAKNILILTDFSGGTWDAVHFAMKFLRDGEIIINLLQTYQKPEVGHSMHRDIVPILEKISIDELEDLRNKILNQFEIPKRKVKLLSIEGNLSSLLSNQLNLNDIGGVVVGLYNSIPDTGFLIQRKISSVIKCSSHPLFILPGRFSDSEINKIVFITDPYNKPSVKVLDKLIYLSGKVRSEIHILFAAQDDTQDNQENIKSNIIKHFPGINVTTDYLSNASMDLIRNYLNLTSCNLVVIEKNNYQRFKRSFTIKLKSSSNCTNGIPVLLIVP
ncbi:MAG: hypothetical protein ISS19_04805 [Bacteroidales bacterium]|nr:hypothetical protein [Bacteroidales bacterium]